MTRTPQVLFVPPEPLRDFGGVASVLSKELSVLDEAVAAYRKYKSDGRILANATEALRVELTYHSNAIEGSTLTLRETALIIEGHAPTSGKSLREIYEARNHDRALRAVERWASEQARSQTLTLEHVLSVHAAVLADIDVRHAGVLRSERVLIKGTRFVPPGPQKFDKLLAAMLALANRPVVHPVLQAAELHYNFVAIHPFADGNGRTARLLMNGHVLSRGYPHVILEVERRSEYLASLEEANAGRVEGFARFVIEAAGRSIGRVIGE